MNKTKERRAKERPPRCSAFVSHPHMFSPGQCSKNGKVERDGKWYCTVHDPVKVKERSDAKSKAYDAEWKAKEVRRERVQRREQIADELARKVKRLDYLLDITGGDSVSVSCRYLGEAVALARQYLKSMEEGR